MIERRDAGFVADDTFGLRGIKCRLPLPPKQRICAGARRRPPCPQLREAARRVLPVRECPRTQRVRVRLEQRQPAPLHLALRAGQGPQIQDQGKQGYSSTVKFQCPPTTVMYLQLAHCRSDGATSTAVTASNTGSTTTRPSTATRTTTRWSTTRLPSTTPPPPKMIDRRL